MRSSKLPLRILLFLALLILPAGCGGGGGGGGGPTLSSITVTPANPSITTGASQQFTATGNLSDGSTQNLTAQATWSSSSGTVRVGPTGLATTSSAGTATITAQSGTITGSTVLTVSGPALLSITVTPANPSIGAGTSQQFTATGTFADGSTQNLTTQVTWTSSSGTVHIGSTGLATTSSGGTATITAQSGTISGSTLLTVTGGASAGANVMAVTVNGSLCNGATSSGYFNKPCVSVTVCNPDGSACQTVNDILLDTGSYGLRIFKQAIPGLTLTQAPSGTGSLAECIQFADNSTIWGPVQTARVQLAGEPAITIPIHVIDASFGTPTSCGTPDANPVAAGYAGILGVGPLAQDCGSSCANSAQIGVYFSCVGSSCTGASVAIANQVPNPVASLPLGGDSNGILVQLPAVPPGGVQSVNGSLLLGIGTQANNTPVSPTVLPTDQQGDFRTLFGGNNSISFLDTGSNALFFPNATSIPICSDPNWYCPPSTLSLSATMIGAQGSLTKTVPFNVGNFNSLFSSTSNVFSETGGPSSFGFDWGLPFFLGRNVFIGINGRNAPGLGTGPYVAF